MNKGEGKKGICIIGLIKKKRKEMENEAK